MNLRERNLLSRSIGQPPRSPVPFRSPNAGIAPVAPIKKARQARQTGPSLTACSKAAGVELSSRVPLEQPESGTAGQRRRNLRELFVVSDLDQAVTPQQRTSKTTSRTTGRLDMRKTLKLAPLAAIAVSCGFALGAAEQAWLHPVIEGHGAVVRLPEAADQPVDGSKICVDVTQGGPSDRINPAIEKLARYLNIYLGAGRTPATVRISAVLHGDAALVALNDEAYARRFNVAENPNLPLIRRLRQAGVELLVCGQALAHKQANSADVATDVQVAVSALTVNVNRQRAGFAYIPLH
ncbi:hypothetical protein GC176_25740 [bacterium]|nr:hypothetical protein [bacterium]